MRPSTVIKRPPVHQPVMPDNTRGFTFGRGKGLEVLPVGPGQFRHAQAHTWHGILISVLRACRSIVIALYLVPPPPPPPHYHFAIGSLPCAAAQPVSLVWSPVLAGHRASASRAATASPSGT